MEVKCPKCRFKYDTAVAPGITELACVCPRCGTPFSYVVTEEMKHPQPEDPAATEQEPKEVEVVTTTENGKPAQPTTGQTSPVTEGGNEGWIENTILGGKRPAPLTPAERQKKRRGCMRNCLLIFLIAFVGLVMVLRSCFGERSYKQTMLEQGINESLNELGDGAIVKDYEPFLVEGAEPVPDWLQGSWRADLSDGYVVITIRGNKISEESGGEFSRGTFFYKKKQLYCKFDGSEEVEHRKVDPKRQCIVYNGVEMEKE